MRSLSKIVILLLLLLLVVVFLYPRHTWNVSRASRQQHTLAERKSGTEALVRVTLADAMYRPNGSIDIVC